MDDQWSILEHFKDRDAAREAYEIKLFQAYWPNLLGHLKAAGVQFELGRDIFASNCTIFVTVPGREKKVYIQIRSISITENGIRSPVVDDGYCVAWTHNHLLIDTILSQIKRASARK